MGRDSGQADVGEARKVILCVLFVPSADRDGKPLTTQEKWKREALTVFGEVFGGATAMPPAEGVWRDDENNGRLVFENPVLVHTYISEEDAANTAKMRRVGQFCRQMLRQMRQGEIGLIINNVYHAFH